MGTLWIILVIQAFVFGAFCSYIAGEKNRDTAAWFLLGLLFSFVALLALIAVPKKLGSLRTHLIWTDFVLAVVLVAAIFVSILGAPPPPVDISHIQILKAVDSLSTPGNSASAHNSVLMSVLLQRSTTGASLRAAREGGAMQARVIFCGFLAAVASLVSKFASDRLSWQIQSVFLLLIAIMFFLDVQLEDSRNRQFAYDMTVEDGIRLLAGTKSTDTTWYALSDAEANRRFQSAFEWPDRWWRKLRLACQPNPERLAYYFVPLILAYLFARSSFRRTPSHIKLNSQRRAHKRALKTS